MCLNVMIDLVYCTDMTLLHSMGGVAYPILMGQRNLTYRFVDGGFGTSSEANSRLTSVYVT